LKQNDYKVFNWDWEKNIDDELKNACKDAMTNYLSDYHKQLFNYYKYLKTNKAIWKLQYNTPMEFIYNDDVYKYTTYVVDFFKYLHSKYNEGDDGKRYVKDITNNEGKFIYTISLHVEDKLQSYFGLRFENDDDDF